MAGFLFLGRLQARRLLFNCPLLLGSGLPLLGDQRSRLSLLLLLSDHLLLQGDLKGHRLGFFCRPVHLGRAGRHDAEFRLLGLALGEVFVHSLVLFGRKFVLSPRKFT